MTISGIAIETRPSVKVSTIQIRLALEKDADRLADLAQAAWEKYRDLQVQRDAIELTLRELPDYILEPPAERKEAA